jgi:carbonic anhydrase/acetyltransferase-like protein (isoleucine patch superfamily)
MILTYNNIKPRIGRNVFIAPTAVVIGDVHIGDNSSIWYGTVVRGDRDVIRIGRNTNIQDNCTLHTDPGKPLIIGSRVSVGHNAVVHGCTLEDDSLVGINSTVLNGAVIKKGSIIGSGAVVKEGQLIGPLQLAAGVPAVIKKDLAEDALEYIVKTSETYMMLAGRHLGIETDLSGGAKEGIHE